LTALDKVIQGEKIDPRRIHALELFKNGDLNDGVACGKAVVEDKRAWVFVYEKQGPLKMAEFEHMTEDSKRAAALQFISELYMKAAAQGQLGNLPPIKQNIIKLN
jgi:hypothetical protein